MIAAQIASKAKKRQGRTLHKSMDGSQTYPICTVMHPVSQAKPAYEWPMRLASAIGTRARTNDKIRSTRPSVRCLRLGGSGRRVACGGDSHRKQAFHPWMTAPAAYATSRPFAQSGIWARIQVVISCESWQAGQSLRFPLPEMSAANTRPFLSV